LTIRQHIIIIPIQQDKREKNVLIKYYKIIWGKKYFSLIIINSKYYILIFFLILDVFNICAVAICGGEKQDDTAMLQTHNNDATDRTDFNIFKLKQIFYPLG